MFEIDWQSMFVPQTSLLEPLVRGTLMYLGLFILLRIFRRQAGSLSIADLLLVVIIADAAQNGMAGESKSITESFLLIVTIVFWDYFLDWIGFKSQVFARVLEPQPLVLIKNGRVIKKNLDREMITEDELMGQLRQQGVEDISEVQESRLESDGNFSVIKTDGSQTEGNKKDKGAVN